MSLFLNLFNKRKKNSNVPPMPSFDEIVDMMFDKSLLFSDDLQIIKVIYNEDKTKRYIVLHSVNGYYKYTYEELCVCDEDEWMYMYICNREDPCPAWWASKDCSSAYSFFGTEDEAMSALRQEPIYREYFTNLI